MAACKEKFQKGAERLTDGTKKLVEIWKDTDKHHKAEWIVLGAILLYCYLTMCYRDIVQTMYDAYHMWDFIFSADIFYLTDWLSGTAYGFSFFLVFGVGMFPVWLIGKLIPLSLLARFMEISSDAGRQNIVTTMGALLWMKLYLTVFVVLVCRELKVIAGLIGIDEKRHGWVVFFYLSSLCVVLPVFHIAQYDIICSYFSLLGVRCFLQDDQKGFFIAFAIAIPMKFFALFLFLPLVFIRYKNVFRIGFSCLFGGCGILFDWIVLGRILPMIGHAFGIGDGKVHYTSIMRTSELLASDASEILPLEPLSGSMSVIESYVMRNVVQVGEFFASVFVIVFALLCIAAYLVKRGEGEQGNRKIVYLLFLSMLSFFLFSYSWNSYWIILLAPYLVLCVFMNERLFAVNCVLELFFTGGMVIRKMIVQHWVFGGGYTYTYLIFKHMRQRTMDTYYLLDKFGFVRYRFAIYAIAVAFGLALAVINLPALRMNERVPEIRFGRGLLWARIAVLLIFIAAGIDCVFFE